MDGWMDVRREVSPIYALVQGVVLEVEAAEAGESDQGAQVVEGCHLLLDG